MRPLRALAVGYLILLVSAPLHGHDLIADPVGWLLILAAVAALPLPGRLTSVGVLALATSVALWFPSIRDWLSDTSTSLVWVASLPQLGFTALLCHGLARVAQDQDPAAAAWLDWFRTGTIVLALLPMLVWGLGVASLGPASYTAAALVNLALTLALLVWSGRPWATRVES